VERISKIIKGWYRVANGKTTKEDKRKADICNECEFANYKNYLDFVDDELKNVKGFVCELCDCPLIAKIRSGDECPANKW